MLEQVQRRHRAGNTLISNVVIKEVRSVRIVANTRWPGEYRPVTITGLQLTPSDSEPRCLRVTYTITMRQIRAASGMLAESLSDVASAIYIQRRTIQ